MVLAADYTAAHAERRRILAQQEAETRRAQAADEARAAEIEGARAAAVARRGRQASRAVELAARHEAAHAVVSIACGRTVVGCGIQADGSGWCWITPGAPADPAHLAGAIAERFMGNARAEPSRADAMLVEGDPRAAALSGFAGEEIVAENWSRVGELAGRLLVAGFLSGEAVADIVGRPRMPTLTS